MENFSPCISYIQMDISIQLHKYIENVDTYKNLLGMHGMNIKITFHDLFYTLTICLSCSFFFLRHKKKEFTSFFSFHIFSCYIHSFSSQCSLFTLFPILSSVSVETTQILQNVVILTHFNDVHK